jgi:hypothetical protein
MRTPPLVAFAACAAAAVALSSAPAFAGEVTGTGGDTQGPSHTNSICAFSGLNDDPTGAGGDPSGRTQNYGHTLLFFDWVAKVFNPGDICNIPYPFPE